MISRLKTILISDLFKLNKYVSNQITIDVIVKVLDMKYGAIVLTPAPVILDTFNTTIDSKSIIINGKKYTEFYFWESPRYTLELESNNLDSISFQYGVPKSRLLGESFEFTDDYINLLNSIHESIQGLITFFMNNNMISVKPEDELPEPEYSEQDRYNDLIRNFLIKKVEAHE